MTTKEKHIKQDDKAQEEPKTVQTEEKGEVPTSKAEAEIETLKGRIVELEQTADSFKDKFLRKAAELENYKKRMENDFTLMAQFANEEIITKLLPILDDLARSLKAGKEQPEYGALYRGIELIYNKFLNFLESKGVKKIETVGKPFDVYYHEALMQIPKEGIPPHTIIEEAEKGYVLHNKVIRHAKVIVAAEPQPVELPTPGMEKSDGPQPNDKEKTTE